MTQKIPFFFLVFSLVFAGFIYGQEDSTERFKTPVDYIRENKFEKAALLLDQMAENKTSYFNFGISLPAALAFEGDSLFLGFLKFNGEGNYNMAPFARILYQICQLHRLKNSAYLAEYKKELGQEKQKNLYIELGIYLAYSELKAQKMLSRDEQAQLLQTLRNRYEPISFAVESEFDRSLLKALRFYLWYEAYTLGLTNATGLKEQHFEPQDFALLPMIPLYDEKQNFKPVFENKLQVVKSAGNKLGESEKQAILVQALLESPSGKHKKQIASFFPSRDSLDRMLLGLINQRQPAFAFGDEIQAYLAQHSQKGQWLVIDVWGTWCGPCVAELPEWNKFYLKSLKKDKIRFLSLSAYSQEIAEFMAAKKYSFPYKELTEAEIEMMKLTGFPTTYLITTAGKYIILPFGEDKEEMIGILSGID